MLHRIIPCLDVRNGRLTKGVKFEDNIDIGDPVETAKRYSDQGADELVFYDITASAEKRGIFLDVVKNVADVVQIPFIVGGGINTVDDIRAVLDAGANKVSINSGAVNNRTIIEQGANLYGSANIVVGMDVKIVTPTEAIPSGYEIVTQGGRNYTGIDAIEWATQVTELGAGEICLNSIDADGTKEGYDLFLTRKVAETVSIPVIASGGAGTPMHLVEAFRQGKAAAALVASIVHYNEYSIAELKKILAENGCNVSLPEK